MKYFKDSIPVEKIEKVLKAKFSDENIDEKYVIDFLKLQ